MILDFAMPRNQFQCDPEKIYHVTNRSINRDWFAMPMESVWEIFERELYFIKHAFDLRILSFVAMSNHFHLLVQAPRGNLSEAMAFFSSRAAYQITKGTQRINHLWAHRFKRTKIENTQQFLITYRYIYQNPVRAEITRRAEQYSYSTLNGLVGLRKLVVPVECDEVLFQNIDAGLAWLNEVIEERDVDYIRKALRRSTFSPPRVRQKKSLKFYDGVST